MENAVWWLHIQFGQLAYY